MLIDPRHGDIEDDAASPGQRSLLAIAGSLLVEISLPKLLFAWTVLLLLPAVLLGLAPLLVSAWFSKLSQKLAALTGIGTALALLAIVAVGWIGWRPLFRIAENNFWSLNALAVQPGYAFTREALRHLTERIWGRKLTVAGRARLRSANSMAAGIVLSACAVLIAMLAWPASRWMGGWNDLALLHRLAMPALANAVLLVSAYLAVASLMWGFADASMQQPVDLAAFDAASSRRRSWRVAHLSDLHVIGDRYGFRIESGRAGPRGNSRLDRVLARLAAIHATDPLDHILITGDMTDAGRASEWAAFLDAIAHHPELAARTVMLPGNHDVNIVDRANPARLDLPFSPGKRLRQIRTLSAMAAVQGDRVRVVDALGKPTATLNEALAPHREAIVALGGTWRPAPCSGAAWPVRRPVSDDPAAGGERRPRHSRPELQCGDAFFLHQRARAGVRRTDASPRGGDPPLSDSALDHRPAPSCGRVSHAGEGILGTHRHGADQWQLVRAQAGSAGRSRRRDARPPPYRLDRRLRRVEDHLRAVTGDGGDR